MAWLEWFKAQLPGGSRCSEAVMLASDLDLELALMDREPFHEGDDAPDRKPQKRRIRERAAYKKIKEGFESSRPTEQIAAAIEFRKQLARSYSAARLAWMVAHLRERFELALGRDIAVKPAKYTDEKTPRAEEPEKSRRQLLAEAQSILEQLKLNYTLISDRDSRINSLRATSAFILFLIMAISSATILLLELKYVSHFGEYNTSLNVLAVLACGSAGAIVSILQRSAPQNSTATKQDPVTQISALRHGASGVAVSVLMGPALAFVLLMLFISGLFSVEGVSPKFAECENMLNCTFPKIGTGVNCATYTDYPKLLLWSFLAGFAERLVPDVLDRVAGTSGEKKA